jgi:hypothetical protein
MSPLVGFLFGLDVCCVGVFGLLASIFWIWMMNDNYTSRPTMITFPDLWGVVP